MPSILCHKLMGDAGLLQCGEYFVGSIRLRPLDPRPSDQTARPVTLARPPASDERLVLVALGARVRREETLGYISDPYTGTQHEVRAHARGVVIGRVQIPVVHEGEALFHIARFSDDPDDVADEVDSFQQAHLEDESVGDPPIVQQLFLA